MRLRAAYIEEPLTFQDIIQALVVPKGEERRAKLLTAVLNSKIAIWYAFHGTASFGSDRPEVKQAELMRLPFPDADDSPEPERARKAATGLVAIIDKARNAARGDFQLQADPSAVFASLDELAYEYFCLSKDEVALIEDAIRYILPAVQPHQSSFPEIWKPSTRTDRFVYASSLTASLNSWFDEDQSVQTRLQAHNADLAVLKLTLCNKGGKHDYVEEPNHDVRELLAEIFKHMHQPLPRNFQLMPDFRIFQGNNLYVVKPMQLRFWLRSAAHADASAIALDLQDYAGSRKEKSRA
jgi:hypothetical protein